MTPPTPEVHMLLEELRPQALDAFEWLGMTERAEMNINYEFGKTLGTVTRLIIERTLEYARKESNDGND